MPALNLRLDDLPAAPARPAITPVEASFALPADQAAAASPALALQRQLGDAVLRGWCAPRETVAPRINARQFGTVLICAAVTWVAAFGGWALLA